LFNRCCFACLICISALYRTFSIGAEESYSVICMLMWRVVKGSLGGNRFPTEEWLPDLYFSLIDCRLFYARVELVLGIARSCYVEISCFYCYDWAWKSRACILMRSLADFIACSDAFKPGNDVGFAGQSMSGCWSREVGIDSTDCYFCSCYNFFFYMFLGATVESAVSSWSLITTSSPSPPAYLVGGSTFFSLLY
jgi:hypothetical protein